jgi:uncharacterized GH25 family protein
VPSKRTMRSRKAKSSNTPLLVGAFVAVLALAAGAFLLLDDGGEPELPDSGGGAVADTDDGDERETVLPPASVGTEERETLKAEATTPLAGPNVVTQQADPEAPTGRVEGVCVDDRGAPVGGVTVRVSSGSPIANMTFSSVREFLDVVGTSGDDGLFALEDVPAGKNYMLIGEHADFAPATVQGITVKPEETNASARLVLRTGAKVGGIVSTLAESPISQARVELYDTVADARLKPDQRRPFRIVFTDGTGRFEFLNVAMSSYKVRVLADGYETQSLTVNSALKAGPEDQDLAFRLADGRAVAGRVVDTTGRPVTEARIEANALKRDYQGNAIAYSDANGYFLLDGMSTEHPYQVRCTARGFSDKTLPSINAIDGDILFELDRRLSIEGWVKTPSGAPVTSFALVLLRGIPNREAALMNDLREFSDAEGHFEFDDLEPGTWGFEARADGYAPTRSETVELVRGGAVPELEITVEGGGTVCGVVKAADGEPMQGALVRINENNFVDTPLLKIFASMSPGVDKPIQRRTNGKGRFCFKNVTPGTYQISVKHHTAAPYVVNDVLITDDEIEQNAEVVIEMPPPASISGVALDQNRRALPFIRVQLSKKNGYVESVTTDESGFFEFGNLSGGNYNLTLYPDRKDDKPINPLLKLVYAQKSLKEIRLYDGQAMTGVELYLTETS